MTKRANGEGNVYRRKDGRYEVRVRDPRTGRRRSLYLDTEAEAMRALRRMATKAEDGAVVLDSGATLRSWGERWLEDRVYRRRRESTGRAYAYRLRRWVWPRLGSTRLRELTALDVEDLAHGLARDGLSASTIKGTLNALAALLSDAAKGKAIGVNVARGVEVPEAAARTAEVVPPTPEQVGALLEHVAGTALAPLLVVLAGTGARIGEALAMQWADVDLESGVWNVQRTTTMTRDGGVRIGARTKSGGGRRLGLSSEVVAALKVQRTAVAELRLASPYWDDHDLAFPTSVGTPQHSQNVRRDMRAAALAVGFPGSFHSLRHFAASVGLSSLPLSVVSKALGHKRGSMTSDVYGHLLAGDAMLLADRLGAVLEVGRAQARLASALASDSSGENESHPLSQVTALRRGAVGDRTHDLTDYESAALTS